MRAVVLCIRTMFFNNMAECGYLNWHNVARGNVMSKYGKNGTFWAELALNKKASKKVEEAQKNNNIIINNKYDSINTHIRKLEDKLSQKSRRKKDGSFYYKEYKKDGSPTELKIVDEEITRLYAKKISM